jgi:hypothetical protein
VIVRHSSDCKDKGKGAAWRKCRCSKTLLVYESDKGKNRRISAKTRSWERAEDAAQELRDSWDPRLQRLKKLESDKESKQVRIEEAVALYVADMAARLLIDYLTFMPTLVTVRLGPSNGGQTTVWISVPCLTTTMRKFTKPPALGKRLIVPVQLALTR